jgi:hypothetical protein
MEEYNVPPVVDTTKPSAPSIDHLRSAEETLKDIRRQETHWSEVASYVKELIKESEKNTEVCEYEIETDKVQSLLDACSRLPTRVVGATIGEPCRIKKSQHGGNYRVDGMKVVVTYKP